MADKLKLRFGWPFPNMKDGAPLGYIIRSSIIVPIVGTISRIWLNWLNSVTVHNGAAYNWWVNERPIDQPLITVCNHHSCLDDPLIYGVLPFHTLWSSTRMRWSVAAHDIVFTWRITSWFFSTGKCVPVIRGIGVYQRGMDFCTERLREGSWVHIYPEGKVNEDQRHLRLKWGIGRLVYDCWSGETLVSKKEDELVQAPADGAGVLAKSYGADGGIIAAYSGDSRGRQEEKVGGERPHPLLCKAPVVLPIYHLGMDSILPNRKPYIPKVGQKVTVVVGEPIDTGKILAKLDHQKTDRVEARRLITEHIQIELRKLRRKAEELHGKISSS